MIRIYDRLSGQQFESYESYASFKGVPMDSVERIKNVRLFEIDDEDPNSPQPGVRGWLPPGYVREPEVPIRMIILYDYTDSDGNFYAEQTEQQMLGTHGIRRASLLAAIQKGFHITVNAQQISVIFKRGRRPL